MDGRDLSNKVVNTRQRRRCITEMRGVALFQHSKITYKRLESVYDYIYHLLQTVTQVLVSNIKRLCSFTEYFTNGWACNYLGKSNEQRPLGFPSMCFQLITNSRATSSVLVFQRLIRIFVVLKLQPNLYLFRYLFTVFILRRGGFTLDRSIFSTSVIDPVYILIT